mmetsp:Transcript_15759/g.46582  ORF Transcript_15759/g.46582 Transcript_15759/m.46582 type:complete len:239 (-) Transcript_15759:358-1074(-)
MADDDDFQSKGPAYDPLDEYASYEDYLDNQITATDMYYLEDVELARSLVELGVRGNGEVIKREEFEQRKAAAEAARQARINKKPKRLASQGKNVEDFPLLQALKDREEAVRNGKLTTIIFVRDKNAKGQEVSGYIDFGHRLRSENMEAVFDRKKRLMPRPTDLSFYNWETQMSTSNPTPNFQVIADDECGLLFKNKRDRKVINVDPHARPGDNSMRTELLTDEFAQVVLFDHVTRRRS